MTKICVRGSIALKYKLRNRCRETETEWRAEGVIEIRACPRKERQLS